MDTSEEFIDMCRKATKIQGGWHPCCGDWFLEYDDPTSIDDPAHGFYGEWRLRIIGSDDDQNLSLIQQSPSKKVFLPRQDQLQEMVREDNAIWLLIDLSCDVNHEMSRYIEYYEQFASMEQLWLAFVMRKMFSKLWDGKKWQKGDQDETSDR